jgi:hypothetical protein
MYLENYIINGIGVDDLDQKIKTRNTNSIEEKEIYKFLDSLNK